MSWIRIYTRYLSDPTCDWIHQNPSTPASFSPATLSKHRKWCRSVERVGMLIAMDSSQDIIEK
jgi:hypothetical protein